MDAEEYTNSTVTLGLRSPTLRTLVFIACCGDHNEPVANFYSLFTLITNKYPGVMKVHDARYPTLCEDQPDLEQCLGALRARWLMLGWRSLTC